MTLVRTEAAGLVAYGAVAPTDEMMVLLERVERERARRLAHVILPSTAIEQSCSRSPSRTSARTARCGRRPASSPSRSTCPRARSASRAARARATCARVGADAAPWARELEFRARAVRVEGRRLEHEEVVAYHAASRTLLVCDLLVSVPAAPPDAVRASDARARGTTRARAPRTRSPAPPTATPRCSRAAGEGLAEDRALLALLPVGRAPGDGRAGRHGARRARVLRRRVPAGRERARARARLGRVLRVGVARRARVARASSSSRSTARRSCPRSSRRDPQPRPAQGRRLSTSSARRGRSNGSSAATLTRPRAATRGACATRSASSRRARSSTTDKRGGAAASRTATSRSCGISKRRRGTSTRAALWFRRQPRRRGAAPGRALRSLVRSRCHRRATAASAGTRAHVPRPPSWARVCRLLSRCRARSAPISSPRACRHAPRARRPRPRRWPCGTRSSAGSGFAARRRSRSRPRAPPRALGYAPRSTSSRVPLAADTADRLEVRVRLGRADDEPREGARARPVGQRRALFSRGRHAHLDEPLAQRNWQHGRLSQPPEHATPSTSRKPSNRARQMNCWSAFQWVASARRDGGRAGWT